MTKYRIYWQTITRPMLKSWVYHDDINTDNPVAVVAGERLSSHEKEMVDEIRKTGVLNEDQAERLLEMAAGGEIFLRNFCTHYCNTDVCYYGLLSVVRIGDGRRPRGENHD